MKHLTHFMINVNNCGFSSESYYLNDFGRINQVLSLLGYSMMDSSEEAELKEKGRVYFYQNDTILIDIYSPKYFQENKG